MAGIAPSSHRTYQVGSAVLTSSWPSLWQCGTHILLSRYSPYPRDVFSLGQISPQTRWLQTILLQQMIGAAITTAISGLPYDLIQSLSRWRSDTYKRLPPQTISASITGHVSHPDHITHCSMPAAIYPSRTLSQALPPT